MVTTAAAASLNTVKNAREAAAYLGATYWQVWHWLNTGRLKGKRDGKEWAVKVSELDRFKNQQLGALKERMAGAVTLRLRADVFKAVWKDEMRAAQALAASEADAFATQYRELLAVARSGRADPEAVAAKGEALGERSESVIAAMLRFQHANDLYTRVAALDDAATQAEWKVAEEVKSDGKSDG